MFVAFVAQEPVAITAQSWPGNDEGKEAEEGVDAEDECPSECVESWECV
jgi:hypothetical protein